MRYAFQMVLLLIVVLVGPTRAENPGHVSDSGDVVDSVSVGSGQNDHDSPVVPLLAKKPGQVDELAWIPAFELYSTVTGRDHNLFPSLDLYLISVTRSWHFRSGFEPQLFAGLAYAKGEVGPYAYYEGRFRTDEVVGGAIGGSLRWNVVEVRGAHLFMDFSPAFLRTNMEIPGGGTPANWLLRSGGGMSVPLSFEYTMEFTFRWVHVSNGAAVPGQNPGWDGKGLGFGLRRMAGSRR